MLRRVRSETELRVASPRLNRHSRGHRSLKGQATSREDAIEHRRCCTQERESTKQGPAEEDTQSGVGLYLGSPTSITSDSSNSLTSPKSAPPVTSDISIQRLRYDVIDKLYPSSTGDSRSVRLKNVHLARGETQRGNFNFPSQVWLWSVS